jgi:hypothetical protein
MLVLGVFVFAFGDQDQQVVGAGALSLALFNAAMAIGQRSELKTTDGPEDRELPG